MIMMKVNQEGKMLDMEWGDGVQGGIIAPQEWDAQERDERFQAFTLISRWYNEAFGNPPTAKELLFLEENARKTKLMGLSVKEGQTI